MEHELSMPHSQELSKSPYPRPCVIYMNQYVCIVRECYPRAKLPKLEDHSWLVVHGYLFNIFATNLQMCFNYYYSFPYMNKSRVRSSQGNVLSSGSEVQIFVFLWQTGFWHTSSEKDFKVCILISGFEGR